MSDLRKQLEHVGQVIEDIKASVLIMCDDMDRAQSVLDKEIMRIAIEDTDKQLSEAQDVYNELLTKLSSENGVR